MRVCEDKQFRPLVLNILRALICLRRMINPRLELLLFKMEYSRSAFICFLNLSSGWMLSLKRSKQQSLFHNRKFHS